MPATSTVFLKIVIVALVLSAASMFLVPAGARKVSEALEQGYIDVGVKRRSQSPEFVWRARHTAAGQPFRFHASLVPWVSAPLFTLMGACMAWLQVLLILRTGSARLVGHWRTAAFGLGGIAAVAGLCTLFFWIPLR